MQIVVYSTSTSPYSKTLKEYLHSINVPFVEKLIDQNDLVKKEMARFTQGYMGVPFTVIQKDDNSIETVIGFDKNKIEQILAKNKSL